MFKRLKAHTHILHKTGMFLSILCLIHCLSMPFIITLLPLVAKDYFSHTTEIYLVIGSLILAVILMRKDFLLHGKKLPLILVGFAAVLQILGLFILPHYLETYFVVSGSAVLFVAYLINFNFHNTVCTNH